MPLPHFTQLQMTGSPGGPGTNPQEPVYKNLFEITFILPTILQAQGRDPVLLLQQAVSVSLAALTPDIQTSKQRFKYSERAFLNAGPPSTTVEPSIKFNVNVNNQGSMETWNTLKAWYDLAWNSQNGYLHYKADMIGTMIVNQHDKKGLVIRRVTFQNCQLTGISGFGDLAWAQSGSIEEGVDAKFIADYWIDEYIDNNFTIQPPFVAGYI
jgi:hypothetical protein